MSGGGSNMNFGGGSMGAGANMCAGGNMCGGTNMCAGAQNMCTGGTSMCSGAGMCAGIVTFSGAGTAAAAETEKSKKWACRECHKAKTACEGMTAGNPCRRCQRLGKTCHPQERPMRAQAAPVERHRWGDEMGADPSGGGMMAMLGGPPWVPNDGFHAMCSGVFRWEGRVVQGCPRSAPQGHRCSR